MGESLIRQGWEGRSIDGKMPLLEYLGGAGDRGVFLTVRQGTQRAAIKLFAASGAEADAYIAQWEAARELTHPHLMPILEFGRCNLDGVDLVHIVTERADDTMANILKGKALDPGEAKSIFEPIVGALAFLHERSVIHGHVKPSNLFKVAGKWKLSTDDLWQAGGIIKQVGYPDEYNAPEAMDHRISPAVDSWSMGMTLAEALTQHRPKWDWSKGSSPAIPGSLPQAMSKAVVMCLRVDPQDRCTITQLGLRLESVVDVKPPEPAPPEPAPEESPAARAVSQFVPIQEAPVAEKVSQPASPVKTAEPLTADPVPTQAQAAAAVHEAPKSQEPTTQGAVQEKPAATAGGAEQKTMPGASTTSSPSTKEEPGGSETRGEAASRRAEERSSSDENDWRRRVEPSHEETEHEAPFESSRPREGRMLFALGDYQEGEEDRPRKRVWPWVLAGVLVLGGAAYLGVHFGTGSPPTTSIAQNAPSSSQPTSQTQPTPQPQNQPTAPQPAPLQSAPASTEPGSQTVPPATQPQQTAPPATNAAPTTSANTVPTASAPTAQVPATTANPTPASGAKDKSATASSSGTEEAKSMEGVSRPPKGRGARNSDGDEAQAARPPNANGEVRDRVVPNVSPAARSSMRRPVEVEIRVAVDRLGKVERAEYMDYGPGNYFARTAYRSAHEWKFAPPLRNGQPQASVWMLTFSFTRRNTEVTATEEDR